MYRSKDLREAAVRYRMEGHTLIETAKVFGVGKTSVSRWEKQYAETGDLSNKPLNRGFKKIEPEKLKANARTRSIDTSFFMVYTSVSLLQKFK